MAGEEESCFLHGFRALNSNLHGAPGLWAPVVGNHQGLCIHFQRAWLMAGQGQCTWGTHVPESAVREKLASLLLRVSELAGDS